MSAPERDDFGTQRVPLLDGDVRDDAAFSSENWSACPSGSLFIPHRVEVEGRVSPRRHVDGNVPLARSVVVVVVEVCHVGTIEVIVPLTETEPRAPGLAGFKAEHSLYQMKSLEWQVARA